METNLSQFKIKLKTDEFAKRRLVSGPIWLELDGVSFPAHEWVDFPVAILGFWLTNIQPLMRGRATFCDFPFMDGPYLLGIHVERKGVFTLTPVDREADEDETLVPASIDSELLLRQLVCASEAVIATCQRNQWIDQDLSNLEALVLETKRHL